MLSIEEFREKFMRRTATWSWQVEGFLDANGYVHPIDTDTKVISTVFERLASPVIRSIAEEHGYIVETSNQTTYPDFTITLIVNGTVVDRIAIDIKTTYRSRRMKFTLGGYNSFLRNGTKNIRYPYNTYREHWVLGFIYSQLEAFREYTQESMPKPGNIGCSYGEVSMFIRHKHEITGLRAGSGNTKNIGSVDLTDAREFAEHLGPFTRFRDAKGACDHYWRNYERLCSTVNQTNIMTHAEFMEFL